MPTYDYRCDACENVFEVFQSFSEDPLSKCPEENCGGAVKKIFSAPGISFKGSGFYKNDNRSKSTSSSSSSSSPDSKSTSSDSSVSDSKAKDSSSNTSKSSSNGD
ncbi:MAG: FmdB family transcriptional regulator [Actinobacteria bacterium]|nr:FmdB family transcriptional regulator [Actinomycetota bacterium]